MSAKPAPASLKASGLSYGFVKLTDRALGTESVSGSIVNSLDALLSGRQKNVKNMVEVSAVRPIAAASPPGYQVIDTAAVKGIRDEYLGMCVKRMGGLKVVYDDMGMGKSTAVAAVARGFKWFGQPNRFLHISIQNNFLTCEQWYEVVQEELGVKGLGMSPHDVAKLIHHALVGKDEDGVLKLWPETEKTPDKFRYHFNFTIQQSAAFTNSYPVLVLDEFNPRDFDDDKWGDGKDYTLDELALTKNMGQTIEFFAALSGLAHQGEGGFVVFVGTRHKSVAKAFLKINGGVKAALAKCTKSDPKLMDIGAWRGLPWTEEEKRSLVDAKFKRRFQEVRAGRVDEATIEIEWDTMVASFIHQFNGPNAIRGLCETIDDEIDKAEMLVVPRIGSTQPCVKVCQKPCFCTIL